MTLFVDARLIDGTGADPVDRAWLRVEGETITGIGAGTPPAPAADETVVDCAGRTLMPGLIDAHAHLAATTAALPWTLPPVEQVLRTAQELADTLADGFTSVRDAAGLDAGFKRAGDVAGELVRGPRLFVANGSLSQTGGHGDIRDADALGPAPYHPGGWSDSLVVDGPDRVRWATREVLRRGADQVKVMAGGGCISPTDPLDSTQFTVDELRAAVTEAEARGTYVMAHTYIPESMHRCMDAGVRTLEHGNMLDEGVAARMAATGTYLVPTLVTYELLAEDGRRLGYPGPMIDKIEEARRTSLEALRIAHAAGVRIGSGADVLGGHQRHKARELTLKARILGPMGAIVASTKTNAEILRRPDLGVLRRGATADLLLVDGDPLADIAVLERRDHIHLVVLGGRTAVDRQSRQED
ncbi:amidohydrolase family protein [Dactylosporangium sp. NPDC000521]|uniref:metal-dependent hydrolase family protein n=1 Tax=Dactylosporangium sp. NPDC000521 TaxID=3363975 RepID=UPI0036A20B8C